VAGSDGETEREDLLWGTGQGTEKGVLRQQYWGLKEKGRNGLRGS